MTTLTSSALPDLFVGRAAELATLEGMFTTAADAPFGIPPRLLTLTGIGGAGKTRLARELVARVQSEFADGSVWIDLAPLSDPAVIARTVLDALELQEQSGKSPLETLVAGLAPKQLLLILDNCEHLLDVVRALCQSLVSHCPELSMLATSREPLGIRGEIVYPVLPLSLPRGGQIRDILDADAVKLFALRAQEILPDFVLDEQNRDAVVRVCTELDGLPLAIELAAARVKMMTVGEIAERLHDALRLLTRGAAANLSRHQTLRAAMDWSYELLSANERALLRRTSIFAGGFTLEAVEQVCGDDADEPRLQGQTLPRPEILDLLSNLVNKSLILIAERSEGSLTRYGMLETVRQYASKRLQEAGEEITLGTRHLKWCVEFSERAEPELTGAEQGKWLLRLDGDLANLRVALQHVLENGTAEMGLQLANALFRYWDRRGDFSEAITWYEQLLAGDLAQVAPSIRARALYCLAAFHFRSSHFPQSIVIGEASLASAREQADRTNMALTLNLLGVVANESADFERALEFHQEALELRHALGDMWGVAASLHNLGFVAEQRGHYRRALESYQESLDLKRQLGDDSATALTLNNMGAIALAVGEYARGHAIITESLALDRALGDKKGIYYNLTNLGAAALDLGDHAAAHTVLREAEELASELGNAGDIAANLLAQGELAQAEGQDAQARALYGRALALFRQAREPVGTAQALYHLASSALNNGEPNLAAELAVASLKTYQALGHAPGTSHALEVLAGIAAARQDHSRAAQLMGAARRLREQAETPVHPYERAALEKITFQSRSALGAHGYERALQHGRTGSLEEIIANALVLAPQTEAGFQESPPELQAFALGQSVVLREGQALTTADWTYAKSKELFFYLLSGQGAAREEIGVDLWADASPAQLRRIFHRVLGTLRKALGSNEWIVFENDKYALNRALLYSYDADLFAQHLAEARRALRTGAGLRPRAVAPLQEAVELYQGDFLPDIQGGDWILFRREALRKEFLEALLLLGQLLSEQKEYGRAAAVYERALAHDNYLEVAHRELMRARAHQGEVGLALKQYQTLVELLRVEFDAQPAPETRALYDRLRQGESV